MADADDRTEPAPLVMGLRAGTSGDDFSMAEDLATATATVPMACPSTRTRRQTKPRRLSAIESPP